MNLQTFQQNFTDLMLGSGDESHSSDVDDSDGRLPYAMRLPVSTESIDLYRHLVSGTLTFTLAGIFVRLRRKLGEHWQPCTTAYLNAHPPTGWDSNDAGNAFPDFLAEQWLPAHPDQPVWWAELAAYELLETMAYLAPEAEQVPTRSHPVVVNNSLQLHVFEWDIPTLCVKESDSVEGNCGALQDPEQKQVIAAIYRDPNTLKCRFLALTPVSSVAIQGWRDGDSTEHLATTIAEAIGITVEACLEQLVQLSHTLEAHQLLRLYRNA